MIQICTFKSPALTRVARSGLRRSGVFLALAGLACLCAAPAQAATLGTTALTEGSAAGSNGVILAVSPASGAWSASANDSWLHVNLATASGTGSTNVLFNYDANPGATRTGTLTLAGLTATFTQASPAYVPVTALDTLAGLSLGVTSPIGVAMDGQSNIYIADGDNDIVFELPAGGLPLITLANSSTGLSNPSGVAVDGAGNVYISDQNNGAVYELPKGGSTLTTLADASTGLNYPLGVAVDGAGNVYIADGGNATIYELQPGGAPLIPLVYSGLNHPTAVAVDVAGNLYMTDSGNRAVYELPANGTGLTMLVSSGLNYPSGVAVDGSGNAYIADEANQKVYELPAGGTTLTTLLNNASGLFSPNGVAVDGAGNVYIADYGAYQRSSIPGAVFELAHAFLIPATPLAEGQAAGNDSLSAVLPATANLTGSRAPVSDSPWLTITGTAGGVVSFAFTANTNLNRTAHINVLGQTITVVQGGPTVLGTTVLTEGPAIGTDSVLLATSPTGGTWTNAANNSWLHINPATVSGVGGTNVLFSFDANPGATRTGTLTIAGLTLTVTQAGSTYTPVTALITLASAASGLTSPVGVAVDGAGNVDIANLNNNSVYQLPAGGFSLNILANGALGLQGPSDVAADAAGNVYIADGTSTVYELTNGATALTTVLSQSYIRPATVAVDRAGNVYVGDNNNGVIYQIPAGGSTLITLADYASGLSFPVGLAVDGAGNVFIADQGNNTIEELPNGGSTLITVATAGLSSPSGVAVDGSGNLYITDQGAQALFELPAGGSTLITLANVSSGLSNPSSVAVDGSGNVYISDTGKQTVYELPRAFVDTTAKMEGAAAGSDSLPVVLPAMANLGGALAPSSQSWLTINSVHLGVVNFAYTQNTTGTNRTASLKVLGSLIPVTQSTTNLPPFGLVTGITSATNNTVTLNFAGQPGYGYSVERSTNLFNWVTIWTTNAPPAGSFSYPDTFGDLGGTAPPAAYYRLAWTP